MQASQMALLALGMMNLGIAAWSGDGLLFLVGLGMIAGAAVWRYYGNPRI